MKKKKFSDFPPHEKNPFIPSEGKDLIFSKRIRSVLTPGCPSSIFVDAVNDEGEVVGRTAFVRYDTVDEETYVKLFTKHCQLLFNLSNAGVRVMLYFFVHMRPNRDVVYFDVSDCLAYTAYGSKATVYKGLAELLEAGVIARGKHNYLFFLNYHIVFNGDRAKFTYEIEKQKHENK